ncbi:hypothetical protein GDO86_017658 [Hymenochirus boettgeri]|uniref:Uncharacterized protein n=1 Tax=Hymenochirus boettgeri TaxID=247094 RepID=A0A8T2IKT7_9PIPI|nr:hypothetical protein GDO86_017658 [Hymenochirus boettgeri]
MLGGSCINPPLQECDPGQDVCGVSFSPLSKPDDVKILASGCSTKDSCLAGKKRFNALVRCCCTDTACLQEVVE